jgi:hypothetical protein
LARVFGCCFVRIVVASLVLPRSCQENEDLRVVHKKKRKDRRAKEVLMENIFSIYNAIYCLDFYIEMIFPAKKKRER